MIWDQIGKLYPSKSTTLTVGFGYSISTYTIDTTLYLFSNAPNYVVSSINGSQGM